MNTGSEPLADGIAETARRLGISRGSVYKLARENKLQIIKLAGRSLVTRAEQARLLAEAAAAEVQQ
jgi:excisionase family DNA binding protein